MTTTEERIRQVRKHGHLDGLTRDEAAELVTAAKAAGYNFARRQTVMGRRVVDLDVPAEREAAATEAAARRRHGR